MTQRFYRPILHTILDKPCIIYPARDESNLATVLPRNQKGSIETYVDNVLQANSDVITRANYLICVPWNIEQQLYLDVWLFELENKSESGPLVTAVTFTGDKLAEDMGTTSGDGLILLGHEEIVRRKHDALNAYLSDGHRHDDLPNVCRADENFYF